MELLPFLLGLILGALTAVVGLALLLFRIQLFPSRPGLRSSSELLQAQLQRIPEPLQRPPSAAPGVQTLLEPFLPSVARGPLAHAHGDGHGDAHGTPSALRGARETAGRALEGAVDQYLGELGRRVGPAGETALWLNALLWRGLHFARHLCIVLDSAVAARERDARFSSASSAPSPSPSPSPPSSPPSQAENRALQQLINAKLARIPRPEFLGPTEVTHLAVGTIAPLIHRIQVVDPDYAQAGSSAPHRDGSLVLDIEFSYAGDSVVELSTSAVVSALGVAALASLPAQVALTNIFFHGTLRVGLFLDPSPRDGASELTLAFVAPPRLQFDIASAIGYQVQLVNIPHIHELLLKLFHDAIAAEMVLPRTVRIPLLRDAIASLRTSVLRSLHLADALATPPVDAVAPASPPLDRRPAGQDHGGVATDGVDGVRSPPRRVGGTPARVHGLKLKQE